MYMTKHSYCFNMTNGRSWFCSGASHVDHAVRVGARWPDVYIYIYIYIYVDMCMCIYIYIYTHPETPHP